MTLPFAMMHRKDFHIIHSTNETVKNSNFIGIDKTQFERVKKNKQYGLVILKEEEQAKRHADYLEAEEYIKKYNQSLGIEDEVAKDAPIESDDIPTAVALDCGSTFSIEEMSYNDLRKMAKELGCELHSKDTIADIRAKISAKLEADEDESEVQ